MEQIDPELRIDAKVRERARRAQRSVEKDYLKRDSVVGIGTGWKTVGGQRILEVAVIVDVREKGVYAPEEEVPAEIDGIKTDVVERVWKPLGAPLRPGRVAARPDGIGDIPGLYDPLIGGVQIGLLRHVTMHSALTGTLGMMVRGSVSNFVLSNWHVLCADPDWEHKEQVVLQPPEFAGWTDARYWVSNTPTFGYLGAHLINGQTVYVDCAAVFADCRAGAFTIRYVNAYPSQVQPASDDHVYQKVGATTGRTWGWCSDTNKAITVSYDGFDVQFFGQYEITPATPPQPFSAPGDSGAIVTSMDGKTAVGLNFAGDDNGVGVANPLSWVLAALGLRLGTSSD